MVQSSLVDHQNEANLFPPLLKILGSCDVAWIIVQGKIPLISWCVTMLGISDAKQQTGSTSYAAVFCCCTWTNHILLDAIFCFLLLFVCMCFLSPSKERVNLCYMPSLSHSKASEMVLSVSFYIVSTVWRDISAQIKGNIFFFVCS